MENNSPIIINSSSLPSWVSARLNREELNEFVVVDIETNGLKYTSDSILSIAAVRYINGKVASSFFSFSKPLEKTEEGTYNREAAANVNMITEPMIEAAPDEEEVMEAFNRFIGCSPIVGHNVGKFDARFIDKAFKRYKIKTSFDYLIYDTLRILREMRIFNKNDLEQVTNKLGIKNKAPHHALSDCLATGELMLYLIEENPFEAVYDNFFMDIAQLTQPSIHPSPIQTKELEKEYIVPIGLSTNEQRLAVIQAIVDNGGKYLHNTQKKTTMAVVCNTESEDEANSRYTQYGSASGKLRKVTDLIAEGKQVKIINGDEFISQYVTPHMDKLDEIAIEIVSNPEEVVTVDGARNIDEVWSEWLQHIETFKKQSKRRPNIVKQPLRDTRTQTQTQPQSQGQSLSHELPFDRDYSIFLQKEKIKNKIIISYLLLLIPFFGTAISRFSLNNKVRGVIIFLSTIFLFVFITNRYDMLVGMLAVYLIIEFFILVFTIPRIAKRNIMLSNTERN